MKQANRWERWTGIIYSALLALIMADSVLFPGFTCFVPEAAETVNRIRDIVGNVIMGLGFVCLLAEIRADWKRIIPGGIALALRYFLFNNLQCIYLYELMMAAVFSNLSTEKKNGLVWMSVHLAYVVFLIVGNACGLLTDVTKDFTFAGQAMVGHSWGMGHPNSIALLVMSSVIFGWILIPNKKWWITFPLFWIPAVGVFLVTACRTAAALMILFPALYYVLLPLKRLPRTRKASAGMPLLLAAVTFGLGIYWGSILTVLPNDSFWLRFKDYQIMLNNGITMFGRFPETWSQFDNVIFWMITYCGVIPAMLAVIGFTWMMFRIAWANRPDWLAVGILFIIYGFMENALVYAMFFALPMMVFATSFRKAGEENSLT